MSVSIINGRLIDPAHGIDDHLDLHIDGECVVAVGDAVLIEASYPLDLKEDPEALRILEAARSSPLLVSSFTMEGRLLAQNPAAAACYPARIRTGENSDLAQHFTGQGITREMSSKSMSPPVRRV